MEFGGSFKEDSCGDVQAAIMDMLDSSSSGHIPNNSSSSSSSSAAVRTFQNSVDKKQATNLNRSATATEAPAAQGKFADILFRPISMGISLVSYFCTWFRLFRYK